MSGKEYLGCVLMLAAVVLAQPPDFRKAGGTGAGKLNRSAGTPVFGVPVDFWLDKRGGLWYTAILYEYVAR